MRTIYNPENGKFDVENNFLTNIPKGDKKPPQDKPWKYILFGRYRSNHHKVLIVLTGNSKGEINKRLGELVKGVRIEKEEGIIKWGVARKE